MLGTEVRRPLLSVEVKVGLQGREAKSAVK
jgi:hypothetical protein